MAVKERVEYECTCNKCGYEWLSRKGEPAQCPKCKSYEWNDAILQVQKLRKKEKYHV